MEWSLFWMIMWQGFIGMILLSIGFYILTFMVVRAWANALHPERTRKNS